MAQPAPLIGIDSAPIPNGAVAEWFIGSDGARLRAAIFSPEGPVKGSVVISPGRTEVIEKYFETARQLMSRGFVVLVHDWRGQGLSHRPLKDRMLGHARGDTAFLSDHSRLLDAFASRLPTPWIGLGHSMGGCLLLLALAKGERRFSGAILSAPMLGLLTGSVPLPVARILALVMTLAGNAGSATPNQGATPPDFQTNVVTHDLARFSRAEAQIKAYPDLALGAPTWGWLDFACRATAQLAKGPELPRLTLPVTVIAAGEDRVVNSAAARASTARLPQGRYIEIPNAFHEILQETDAIQSVFWKEFDDLSSRVTAGTSSP